MTLSDLVSAFLALTKLFNINCINSALEYSSDANPISVKEFLEAQVKHGDNLEAVITNQSPVMVQVIYV